MKTKSHFGIVIAIALFLISGSTMAWGQSYLGLDGGLEGSAAIDNVTLTSAPQYGKWTRTDGNLSIADETSTVRSGSHSLKISMTFTSLRRVWTPLFDISSTTSKFYVQYYRRSASNTTTQTQIPGYVRSGTELPSTPIGYTTVSVADVWEKVTYASTSVIEATSVAGLIFTKAFGSGGDVFVDDFCIYAATSVDNDSPNPPTLPSSLQTANVGELSISWTDASGGIDCGGYMVIRKIGSAPTTTPNANGIYAIGNTLLAGELVAYVGTLPSFTDVGLDPSNTYFYTIYTFDKAYNYSSGVQVSGMAPLPVEMISFTAFTQNMDVQLKWTTVTETNNYGFEIERRTVNSKSSAVNSWGKVGFIPGSGTSNIPHEYSYSDVSLSSGRYSYRLKQIDNDGAFKYSNSTEIEINVPKVLKLFGNYPNPFNPSTKIQFTVPESGSVRLRVYNVLGQEIKTLFNGVAEAGNLYTTYFDAMYMATGLYFSVLEFLPGSTAGSSQRITHKMVMTK